MSNSANPEEYDLVVLGSGEAGKYLAWTLAREGKSAAVVFVHLNLPHPP